MIEVDGRALWEDIIALGEITETDKPYTRRSFSPLFLEGRAWLTQRMKEAGLTPRIDTAGNLIGRLEGTHPAAGVIVVGSHSDSVPSGGRFDGMAGVAAGIAVARALTSRGRALEFTLDIIDFLAEEPSEFGLSCIGSRASAGCLTAEHLTLRNPHGETLETALVRMGADPARLNQARRTDIEAAFELHIEQGPVLESEGIDVGIVTAIVGITRLEIEFTGTAGHAGTTPMTLRRDPLIAAAELIGRISRTAAAFAARRCGHFVATVGSIEVLPGAANVIPKTARVVVDARSESRAMMEEFRAALDAASLDAAAAANVERTAFKTLSDTLPALCDSRLRRLLEESAAALGYSAKAMASGAGHDMAFISRVAPASMVFIPCKGGRSHTPEEWARPEALTAGANVILDAILRFKQTAV